MLIAVELKQLLRKAYVCYQRQQRVISACLYLLLLTVSLYAVYDPITVLGFFLPITMEDDRMVRDFYFFVIYFCLLIFVLLFIFCIIIFIIFCIFVFFFIVIDENLMVCVCLYQLTVAVFLLFLFW